MWAKYQPNLVILGYSRSVRRQKFVYFLFIKFGIRLLKLPLLGKTFSLIFIIFYLAPNNNGWHTTQPPKKYIYILIEKLETRKYPT